MFESVVLFLVFAFLAFALCICALHFVFSSRLPVHACAIATCNLILFLMRPWQVQGYSCVGMLFPSQLDFRSCYAENFHIFRLAI